MLEIVLENEKIAPTNFQPLWIAQVENHNDDFMVYDAISNGENYFIMTNRKLDCRSYVLYCAHLENSGVIHIDDWTEIVDQ